MPATCPYPEPDHSCRRRPIPLPENSSHYYPPIYAWFFLVVCTLGFPTKTLYTPLLAAIRATCTAYLVLNDLINTCSLPIKRESRRSFIIQPTLLHRACLKLSSGVSKLSNKIRCKFLYYLLNLQKLCLSGRNKLETTSLICISINRFIVDIPVNMRMCSRLRGFGDTLYFTNRRRIN